MQRDERGLGARQAQRLYTAMARTGVNPAELAEACGLQAREFTARCYRDGAEFTRADMRTIADRLALTRSQAAAIFFDEEGQAET